MYLMFTQAVNRPPWFLLDADQQSVVGFFFLFCTYIAFSWNMNKSLRNLLIEWNHAPLNTEKFWSKLDFGDKLTIVPQTVKEEKNNTNLILSQNEQYSKAWEHTSTFQTVAVIVNWTLQVKKKENQVMFFF